MYTLDLSLEIPGAPVVCRSPIPPCPPPAQAHAHALSAPAVFEDGADVGVRSLSTGSPISVVSLAEAGFRPQRPDDVMVRQSVAEALSKADPTHTSVVPAAAAMAGELACRTLQIQGELSGSVTASGLVYIERDAVLIGPVKSAEMVILAGTVLVPPNATAIRSTGLVVLTQSARVIGHIQCRSIAIYEGACVVGTVQALGPDPKAAQVS